MSAYTKGPWAVFHDHPHPETARSLGLIRQAGTDYHATALAEVYLCEQPERAANASLMAAAPVLLQELQKLTDDAEQAAFEEWLAIVCPSGDVEQVQRQWEASSACEDFYDQWKGALAAIQRATAGENE